MRIVHRRAFMTAITQWSQAQSRCAILQNADWLITPDANYILLALALAACAPPVWTNSNKHIFCSCCTKPRTWETVWPLFSSLYGRRGGRRWGFQTVLVVSSLFGISGFTLGRFHHSDTRTHPWWSRLHKMGRTFLQYGIHFFYW